MTDRNIASRPSLEQVLAIVDFMEKHPALALGQLRGLEGRHESKQLWFKLTKIVNNINGPTRPMKSWIKYWADKKSTVRSKVQSSGGDANSLCSIIEKKIFDLFLAHNKNRNPVKLEEHYAEETFFDEEEGVEENMLQNHVDNEPAVSFEEPVADYEERQMLVMEKLVKVMGEQASAMSQLAQASRVNAQAMERLADASHIQARAIERLANVFETIGGAAHDMRNAIVDIDSTMKRFYTTAPT